MKSGSLRIIIFLSVFSVFSMNIYAHRPLTTEDAGVNALGKIVIQTAYDQTRDSGNKTDTGILALVIGLGRVEVGFEGHYVKTPEGEKGLSDLLFNFKLLMFGTDEKSGMLTFKGEASSTTGNEKKGLGNEDWIFGGSLVLSKEISFFTLHLQGGYKVINDGTRDTDSYFYGAALDFPITEKFTISVETYGSYNKDSKPVSAGGGFFYEINKAVVFDILAAKGLNKDADDWKFCGGFTFIF